MLLLLVVVVVSVRSPSSNRLPEAGGCWVLLVSSQGFGDRDRMPDQV
jgi:hypothetical protein